jgi:hypothetical protein
MARHELIDTQFLHLGHFVMGDVCHDCQRSFLLAVGDRNNLVDLHCSLVLAA